MTRQTVSEILREKLDYLRQQDAICSDPAQRFSLKKQIEDAEAELVRLSGSAQAGFDHEIEQRLADLEVRLEAAADQQLAAAVKRDIAGAGGDLSIAPTARTRHFIEIVVRDLYRRERSGAGPKPLFDMIEDLCAQSGPLGPRIAADLGYIRSNGDLVVHPQDEPVDIADRHRQVEVIVLMTINLVEWYLADYLPGHAGPRAQTAADLPRPPNPYRGLLAFREEDAPNYFGRETDAADVLAALQRQPLVAVVGPSGSGKSSLVRAGVLPDLRTAGDWAVASFRPRGRPLAELARALVGTWQDDPVKRLAQADELAGLWSAGKVPLIDAVHETLRQTGKRRLFLIADQFEEVWTLGADTGPGAEQVQRFLDLLAAAVADAAAPGGQSPALCLLPTLRADFLGHALGHRGLADALDRYPKKLLGPVTDPERLRAIVCEPARRAGVQFEDLLVERILRDLAQLPGDETPGGGASLPLLEFTLEQLWGLQRERRLTHLGYEELGGIQSALSRHADAVYATFTAAERERVRHVLVQMVRPGEGTADTRQVATRAQVRPENWPLVIRLADARLVVTGHDAGRDTAEIVHDTGRDTAEIVHEALIQYWQPLRDWLREDRAFRLWQNGLRQAQAEWERTDRDPGALLAGARLAKAEEGLTTQGERLGEEETGYIQASLERRAAEVAERERQRQELERQRRERERLQRRINIGLMVFLAVALVLAGLAGWQWWVAEQQQTRAEQQQVRAEQQAAEATLKEKDARHNLGFVFVEKAERALPEHRLNEARLYALHALANFDPRRTGPERATSLILSNAAHPLSPSSFNGANHEDAVTSVSFSRDGRTLATGSLDNTVRLWDVATGQQKAVLAGHTESVFSVSFSPDGRTLASGSWDGVRLWDVATGQQKAVLAGHTEQSVKSVCFSPDGRTLATGSLGNNTVRLWDAATGQQKAVLAGHTQWVNSVTFSPDGRTLASGSGDTTLRLWDVETGQQKAVLVGHTEPIESVRFSPDGRTLASGSGDETARLWDAATGQQRAVLVGHTVSVNCVSFSPDGRTLATGSWDSTVRLWDVATGQQETVLAGHRDRVESVGFSPDGRTLASGAFDKTVRLWDVATGQQKVVLGGFTKPVANVSFSPDGRTLASAASDKTVRLWVAATGQQTAVLAGHTLVVTSVSFSPDGRSLASGSADNTVRLWDAATGREKLLLAGHTRSVDSVSFSPDGRTVASGSWDKTVRLWDAATGQQKAVLAGHMEPVTSVSFSPDGRTLATGSGDKTARLWDAATGQEKAVLAGHTGWVTSVSFSPDDRTLASGSADKTIRLWDAATGQQTAVLAGHTGSVESISFSLDGRTLASASVDKTLRLWDAATGEAKAVLAGHAERVTSVSFSPDAQTLVSGSDDKTVRLWDISFLHDPRSIKEQIQEAERQSGLHLVDLDLQPLPPQGNLDQGRSEPPIWSQYDPLHWLPTAEEGDSHAMLELGIIYDRANDLVHAETWYRRAAKAAEREGKELLATMLRRRAAALSKAQSEGDIAPAH